jgi:hypothetical protein
MKGGYSLEDLNIGGRKILKWILTDLHLLLKLRVLGITPPLYHASSCCGA